MQKYRICKYAQQFLISHQSDMQSIPQDVEVLEGSKLLGVYVSNRIIQLYYCVLAAI